MSTSKGNTKAHSPCVLKTTTMGNFLAKIAPGSALSQDIYPPSSKFNPARDIPDLSGKVHPIISICTDLMHITDLRLSWLLAGTLALAITPSSSFC